MIERSEGYPSPASDPLQERLKGIELARLEQWQLETQSGTLTPIAIGYPPYDRTTGVEAPAAVRIDTDLIVTRAAAMQCREQLERTQTPGEPSPIVIESFDRFGSNENLLPYTICTAAVARTIPLIGKRVLDIGCGNGIVSSLLARSGAELVVGVDLDDDQEQDFTTNIHTNATAPGVDTRFIAGDITDPDFPDYRITGMGITHIIANLGPHYGEADMKAIELLDLLPECRVFIGGGYCLNHRDYNPAKAFAALQKRGFIHIHQLQQHRNIMPRMAFVFMR